jgi:hypothetical protein
MRRLALLAVAALAVAGGALGYVGLTDGPDAGVTPTADTGAATDTPSGAATDTPSSATAAPDSATTTDTSGRPSATGEGPAVRVTTLRPFVVVGNESDSVPDGARTDVSCTDQEPMPGNATLAGRLTLERPGTDAGAGNATYRIRLTVADGAITATGTVTLAPGESARTYLTTLVPQPPSLSGDDTVTVRAVVGTGPGNGTVATTTRTVDVVERNVPCEDGAN